MARAGITLNDVTQAASQLQGRGQNPTIDSIRQLLGTGSKTTITQLLRDWRSQQQVRERQEVILTQLESSKSENKQLHELAKHIQSNLEHYQEAVQQQRIEQTHALEKQQAMFQQELENLQQQLFFQQQRAQELEVQCQLKNQALHALENLKIEYERKSKEHQENECEYIIFKDRCEQLQQKQQDKTEDLEKKTMIINELEKQQSVLNERTEQFERSLIRAEDKIEALRNEKMFLIQEKTELQGLIKIKQKTFD